MLVIIGMNIGLILKIIKKHAFVINKQLAIRLLKLRLSTADYVINNQLCSGHSLILNEDCPIPYRKNGLIRLKHKRK